MKKTLEKLWNEYLLDACAVMDTDEERQLTKKIGELHKKANALLSKDQEQAVLKYVDALCDLEALFAKKAFFKGCEFAVSFLLEAGIFEKGETLACEKGYIDISDVETILGVENA